MSKWQLATLVIPTTALAMLIALALYPSDPVITLPVVVENFNNGQATFQAKLPDGEHGKLVFRRGGQIGSFSAERTHVSVLVNSTEVCSIWSNKTAQTSVDSVLLECCMPKYGQEAGSGKPAPATVTVRARAVASASLTTSNPPSTLEYVAMPAVRTVFVNEVFASHHAKFSTSRPTQSTARLAEVIMLQVNQSRRIFGPFVGDPVCSGNLTLQTGMWKTPAARASGTISAHPGKYAFQTGEVGAVFGDFDEANSATVSALVVSAALTALLHLAVIYVAHRGGDLAAAPSMALSWRGGRMAFLSVLALVTSVSGFFEQARRLSEFLNILHLLLSLLLVDTGRGCPNSTRVFKVARVVLMLGTVAQLVACIVAWSTIQAALVVNVWPATPLNAVVAMLPLAALVADAASLFSPFIRVEDLDIDEEGVHYDELANRVPPGSKGTRFPVVLFGGADLVWIVIVVLYGLWSPVLTFRLEWYVYAVVVIAPVVKGSVLLGTSCSGLFTGLGCANDSKVGQAVFVVFASLLPLAGPVALVRCCMGTR